MTYEAILKRMLANVPDDVDKREGSIIYDALAPCAAELAKMYIDIEQYREESYAETASREFLIKRAAERGLTPRAATRAILSAEFNVFVPIGSRFSLDGLNYVVTDENVVTCETAGVEGNKHFGDALPIDFIDGLETAKITSLLIPGEDDEDTEALRERYFGSFNIRAFGGNKADYIEKISAIAGVGGVKITRVWNADIRPAELVPSESVLAWFESASGTLSEDVRTWLAAIIMAAKSGKLTAGGCVLATILNSEFNPASAALIERVKETLDPSESAGEGMGVIPIGHVVTVQSAEAVEVDVSANITFDEGYGWDNLQNTIDSAVSEYLLELRKSWQNASSLIVRISQIETRILGIKGVVDISDAALNGSPANLTLGAYEVPVFGKAAANE